MKLYTGTFPRTLSVLTSEQLSESEVQEQIMSKNKYPCAILKPSESYCVYYHSYFLSKCAEGVDFLRASGINQLDNRSDALASFNLQTALLSVNFQMMSFMALERLRF